MTSHQAPEQANPQVIDIYARLSKAVNGQTITVDDQIRVGTEAIMARGARVGRVFKDNSKSAWNPKVVRKDWEALMSRLESGGSDGVWVLDVTRFSRKMMEGERLIELAARGIQVWSRSVEYDLMTADGRKHFRDAMVRAAGESDTISERTRDGKRRRASRGRSLGGRRGYGKPGWLPVGPDWERGDPREPIPAEQVEFERGIIREGYDRIFAGETLSGIIYDLRARDVRTTDGNPFSTLTLREILCHPYVAGLLDHNGEIVGTLVRFDPIVSEEEWRRMCAIFAARRRGRPLASNHKLSGTMRCTTCGQRMYGTLRSDRLDDQGNPVHQYRCQKTVNRPKACGRNTIDARVAEAFIGDAIKARLGDPRRAERVARHLARVRDERGTLEAQKAVLEETADGLAEKTAAWGFKRVDMAMKPVLTEIEKINLALASLDDTETDEAAAQDAASIWDEAYERNDVEALRAMVKRALPSLAIRPDKKPPQQPRDRFDWDGTDLPNPLP